jgi:hypothetical protein
MKLHKRLTINGAEVPLVSENIQLNHDRPGRAIFQVQAQSPLQGRITFAAGWDWADRLTRIFTGDIERSTTVDAHQQRLFCREVSARLDAILPVALRHPTLQDVLAAYAARTGLSFITPPRPYASVRVPYFGALGTGYQALDSLGAVFGIAEYMWQTQGDGQIFAGSWQDSRWPALAAHVPEEAFGQAGANGGQVMPAVPAMRPGAVLNGRRVQTVRFFGHQMEVACRQ